MDLAMRDKKAIVTGASEGIGKAITRALAREGVDVAICARRKEPLEKTAADIAKETGRKIVPIAADLTKPADAEKFVKSAHAALCSAAGMETPDVAEARKAEEKQASDNASKIAGNATIKQALAALAQQGE